MADTEKTAPENTRPNAAQMQQIERAIIDSEEGIYTLDGGYAQEQELEGAVDRILDTKDPEA
ncbi:hypothetical protein QJ043_02745 [Olsenella sp. YH-ols2217]|uniref:DksA C4-type domain-containing protein n=1 Tax=Kribbibacterium absianum TaxID=3044210 RepID=A0ABT6ZIX5_9ACTN|nr:MULTISPECIES: hypothetical protein [unclassified Olsenella]MDJ1121512.1 hypothetical protein [Olsenella sp. YH-ols2216]MDJ1129002.1 hypothetical protein [Olsenella sp. YH-ols2217]